LDFLRFAIYISSKEKKIFRYYIMIMLKDIIVDWTEEEKEELNLICKQLYCSIHYLSGDENNKFKKRLELLLEKKKDSFRNFGLKYQDVNKTMTKQLD